MASASDDRDTNEQTTALYRAVVFAEWQSLENTKVFSNLAGLEVKYFATTLDGAKSFAAQASLAFGDGPFWIVGTSIRTNYITEDMRCFVDQGAIPTITLPNELFPERDPPETVWAPTNELP
ncbi:MAG TPA: hypothetical protein VN802_03515 [Stellaceae bacterium]|nr:hypothetical protein [Stellaceae bacterium]